MKSSLINTNQEQVFDLFADDYHLLLENWEDDLKKQGSDIDQLLKCYSERTVKTVLDCMCGIGTQAIGLALMGYEVTGADISGKSIQRAAKEAERFNVNADFIKADVRILKEFLHGTYDAVICCDNSLPALLLKADMMLALENMYEKLESSGCCIISIRNYDKIFAEKKRFNPRHIHESPEGRTVIFDLWDYSNDDFVIFNVFYLTENNASGWNTKCRKMVYRALYKDDFIRLLKETGFQDIEVINFFDGSPLQFDFYICKKT